MVQISVSSWDTAILGYPQADGFDLHYNPLFSAIVVASGNPRFSRDRRSNSHLAKCRCIFEQDTFHFFEVWFFRILNRGQYWMEMPLRTSIGLDYFDCHFVDGYNASFLGGREPPLESWWEVTFTVEYIYGPDNVPDINTL